MQRFRFLPLGNAGDYERGYLAIYRGGPVRTFKIYWQSDGSLKLPRGAREIGDDLYLAFIEWLEERYPLDAFLAKVRLGLRVPLETPTRWH